MLLTACAGLPKLRSIVPTPTRALRSAAATAQPTALPTPVPTPVPVDTFRQLIRPFVREAQTRRATRRAADPSFADRIDPDLNLDRINFSILGYGPTYEPPFHDQIGSPTILSLNLSARLIDVVSLTHDLRAPEIERYQLAHHAPPDPTKIDQAYWRGGFDLSRLVMEDATGFSVDFQVTISDDAVGAFVDNVLGKLEVVVPVALDTAPYQIDQEMHPGSHFSVGPQSMNGRRVLEYMQAIETVHDIAVERNARKAVVFGAVFHYMQEHSIDPFFWLHAVDYVNQQTAKGQITADFDVEQLVVGNLNEVARGMISFATNRNRGSVMPTLNRSVYIVDKTSGDGGTEWVSLSDNRAAIQDIQEGIYPNLSFQIPLESNPYAEDLPYNYWWSVRRRIKTLILGLEPKIFREKEQALIDGIADRAP